MLTPWCAQSVGGWPNATRLQTRIKRGALLGADPWVYEPVADAQITPRLKDAKTNTRTAGWKYPLQYHYSGLIWSKRAGRRKAQWLYASLSVLTLKKKKTRRRVPWHRSKLLGINCVFIQQRLEQHESTRVIQNNPRESGVCSSAKTQKCFCSERRLSLVTPNIHIFKTCQQRRTNMHNLHRWGAHRAGSTLLGRSLNVSSSHTACSPGSAAGPAGAARCSFA